MENLSRRSFLQKGSLAVGAAGVMAVGPAIGGAAMRRAGLSLPAARPAPPATAGAHDEARPTGPREAGPVVAHVRDLDRGEIDVFVGSRKVTVRDRAVAARLYRATRQ